MIMNRTKFFLALVSIWLIPLVAYKCIWLMQSRKVNGVFAFESLGPALDQIRFPHSEFWFRNGRDTVWIIGPGGLHLKKGAIVPLRYIPGNESHAKVDNFKGIWMGTVIYGGIILLVFIAVFLHPEIIPYRSRVKLTGRRPFVQVMS
jgi:hypothetical protein